jgi:hypothetical protein
MDHLIELTEWETGEVVLIDPRAIALCERLSADITDYGDGEVIELGARTKIIVAPQQIVLVRETPHEIRALSKSVALQAKADASV